MPTFATHEYITNRSAIGSYTGNETSHTITLGFRPRKVKIYSDDNEFDIRCFDGGKTTGMGRASYGQSKTHRGIVVESGGITITDTGFTIGSNIIVNKTGLLYHWEVQ